MTRLASIERRERFEKKIATICVGAPPSDVERNRANTRNFTGGMGVGVMSKSQINTARANSKYDEDDFVPVPQVDVVQKRIEDEKKLAEKQLIEMLNLPDHAKESLMIGVQLR